MSTQTNSEHGSISAQDHVSIGECIQEINDELLLSAARSGDSAAFTELCQRHSRKILLRIQRITRNREDTEDALQDTLLRAFIHLQSFEGRSTFSSWLTRIGINSALQLLRKRRASELLMPVPPDDSEDWRPSEIADQSETPEACCERREREQLLRSAILRLPSIFREVIELRHVREYSTIEIAEALGITVAAAKSRLVRARKAVQQLSISGAVCLEHLS